MALTRLSVALVAILLLTPQPSIAQTAQAELAVTSGGSTEETGAFSSQLRLFGEPRPNLRYFVEATFGTRSSNESDAFGTAYPYDKRVRPMETYGEKLFKNDSFLLGIRAGRYRTPFGIYGRSDQAYTGFLRSPLIRYDDYFGLSNNFLEGGLNVTAGVPSLHAEMSVGIPQDVGEAVRARGVDPVIRVEGYRGHLIVGVSHIRSKPYDRRVFVRGDMVFTGVDIRYMAAGVQLRGEWIHGQPFDNANTKGWYLDAMVHRSQLGPATLVARVEQLDYDAGRFSRFDKRVTAGARVQLPGYLVAQVNVNHQPTGYFGSTRRSAFDAGLTWVIRYPQRY